jgi:hypothetical protein
MSGDTVTFHAEQGTDEDNRGRETMTIQAYVRELYARIHYAKVNGLFSDHDLGRHYGMIVGGIAGRASTSSRLLEKGFRAAYGMNPIDFIKAA